MLSTTDHVLLMEREREREGECELHVNDLRYLGSRKEKRNIKSRFSKETMHDD